MSTSQPLDPGTDAEAAAQAPALRIVTPDATPEEIAALVTVFAALGGEEPAPKRRTPEWSANHRKTREVQHFGPGAWRSSALPR